MDYSRYDSKGPNTNEVSSDLSHANLRDAMIKYYEVNIKVTEASAEKLLSTLWDKVPGNEERRKMITASSVGLIAKCQPTTKVSSKVKQLLYSKISWKQGYGLGLISRGC